ncbi:MAG TPA: hypothetical protein VFP65_19210 [Anaeromyxobacteraceae bacterium]|nr:hypothetical protein [Anaeromyxobacteraceae bacterium]
MSPEKAPPSDLPARPASSDVSSEKVVVTFRFPRDLASWLGAEAKQRGWSMNEFLVTLTHDLYAWYALPDMVSDELERDREALGLDRRKYVMHVLMRRYHEALEKGPGFDRKAGTAAPSRRK